MPFETEAEKVPVGKPRAPKVRPNRIFELTKERKWTYADVAERIRKAARARGDEEHAKTHEITINRLSSGKAKMTTEWMKMLGEAFSVPDIEIISVPVAQNLRRVRVIYALSAGVWRSISELPISEQQDIMIPNDPELQASNLYAGEIRGPDTNLRYSPNSIVVIAALEQKPGEIAEGKRYHVRLMRLDGMIEDSIKTLAIDREGQYWFKPESDHPAHQEWVPLKGTDQCKVEIVGRVRGVFTRED